MTSAGYDEGLMTQMPETAPLCKILSCLSRSIDLVSRRAAHHHEQVSFIALAIAEELGYEGSRRTRLFSAACLHDVGAFSASQLINRLDFDAADRDGHAEIGYRLLRGFEPMRPAADIVRFHHLPWQQGIGRFRRGAGVPEEAHLLHLADRVAISIDRTSEVLGQSELIVGRVQDHSGSLFIPEQIEAFTSLARKDSFWSDMVSPRLEEALFRKAPSSGLRLDPQTLLAMGKMFSRIIDFRSPFTAAHSSGVAATAQALAAAAGLSEADCLLMRVAGLIHDLGKLAVPTDILQKAGRLTREEFNSIRSHPFHTTRNLGASEVLGTIAHWGALHHERPDGTGQQSSLGARIVALADVFTALAENRPYRAGLQRKEALSIIAQMASAGTLDGSVVALLRANYRDIDSARVAAQAETIADYRDFLDGRN